MIKNKNDEKENSKTKRISVKSIILDEQSGKNNNCSQLYDKYMASKLVNGLNGLNRIKNLIGDINANYIDDENEKNNYDTKNENEDPFK